MYYRADSIYVSVAFDTRQEAEAYAVGRLESWFRLTWQEAPDWIRKESYQNANRFPGLRCTTRVRASLGTDVRSCYVGQAQHNSLYYILSPDLDDYAGKKCLPANVRGG